MVAADDGSGAALFMSMYSLLAGRLRFFFPVGSILGSSFVEEGEVVGILRVPPTDMAMAGTVPVPVAAMMDGSACSSNHRMVSPSDLWPSSRVNWKIRAAHVAGIRILRPRPSTFVCRSFVDALFAGGGCDGASSSGIRIATGVALIAGASDGDLSSTYGSSFNKNAGIFASFSAAGGR